MEVVVLLAFVGLVLVGGALLLFGFSLRSRDYQHADRLALLPILHDDAPSAPVVCAGTGASEVHGSTDHQGRDDE